MLSLAPAPERHGPLVDTSRGMAGAKTVTSALHELVCDDGERPYERPPLTKDHRRGNASREKAYVTSRASTGARGRPVSLEGIGVVWPLMSRARKSG